MHKVAMEMGKWAMEKAKTHGFDNLSAQDWDDLKDCMEAVKCAICADKDCTNSKLWNGRTDEVTRSHHANKVWKSSFQNERNAG